ncbi:MAG: DUF1566 domain-containing protein [Myxococcota bacterium]
MRTFIIIAALGLISCTDKDEITVPGGSGSPVQENQNDNGSNAFNCSDGWTEQNGYFIDPVTCLAWSPLKRDLDWYESVNPNQAASGGCSEYCDDNDINYCADLTFGSISTWRLPSIDELEELSMRSPPFENHTTEQSSEGLDADLWSYNSDTFDDMAWTVNFAQAGMFFTLEKDTIAAVRCVTD